jgi:predicted acyltransferase
MPPPLRLATFRLPGVLQRIAIVYVAVVAINESLSLRAQVAVATIALLGYWAVLTMVPVPGVGPGVLTPGGNLASFIDRRVFGLHMLTPEYDPEGLLSTLPAIVTAMLGAFAGVSLKRSAAQSSVLALWAAGFATTAVGFLWGRLLPINKNLWTSSFVLLSGGLAAQVMAVFHLALESATARFVLLPLAAFGRNALAAYFLSVGLDSVLTRTSAGGVPVKTLLYRVGFASWLRPCCGAEAASLAYAIAYVAVWGMVVVVMYKRRVFIAV